MVALHDLHCNFLFSCQMICKQYIILNHVCFWYESNLEPVTLRWKTCTILLLPTSEVWGKVIFSVACVKNSVLGGSQPHCMLGYLPGTRHPPGTRPPNKETPLARRPPGKEDPRDGQYASLIKICNMNPWTSKQGERNLIFCWNSCVFLGTICDDFVRRNVALWLNYSKQDFNVFGLFEAIL